MNKNERFVITINRELGSGGRTVGRILAEKLGVPYYDKALAHHATTLVTTIWSSRWMARPRKRLPMSY